MPAGPSQSSGHLLFFFSISEIRLEPCEVADMHHAAVDFEDALVRHSAELARKRWPRDGEIGRERLAAFREPRRALLPVLPAAGGL